MIIEYDKPIEVTPHEYRVIMGACKGIVAGSVSEGKWYIKVWGMVCAEFIKQTLTT